MRVLGIIPARGGSKGIPRKNIRFLCGKPLLQYTAEAALASKRLTRVILSSDDSEIIELGKKLGLGVPFVRPKKLARDKTPTLPVIQHALRFLERQGERYDAICLLQPTHPLRRTRDIDACIDLLEKSEADSVVTVLPVPAKYNPHWTYLQTRSGLLKLSTGEQDPITRRQDLPPAFHREGSVYITRRKVIFNENSLYGKKVMGYSIDPGYSVNIDSLEDWERAKRLMVTAKGKK